MLNKCYGVTGEYPWEGGYAPLLPADSSAIALATAEQFVIRAYSFVILYPPSPLTVPPTPPWPALWEERH